MEIIMYNTAKYAESLARTNSNAMAKQMVLKYNAGKISVIGDDDIYYSVVNGKTG